MSKKTLVAYFSYGGGTAKLARVVAGLTEADLVKIEPVEAYPDDEDELAARSKQEADEGARPAITVEPAVDVADYDVVLLGTPNWWNNLAAPVASFVAQNDLAGKDVAVFSSEGGNATASLDGKLAELAPDAKVKRGIAVYAGSANKAQLQTWLQNIDVL